jgi:citrate lyase subunit beta/citryl-CoA lyase
MSPRSFLYVSADRPDHLAQAGRRGADALIVDLEDAVAPDRKQIARDGLDAWLATTEVRAPVTAPMTAPLTVPTAAPTAAPTAVLTTVPIWVRVNAGQLGLEDLAQLAHHQRIEGFCLAKTEGPESVRAVDALLTRLGSTAALAPVLEDAGALFAAREIAAAPRVRRLQLGEADLRASVGLWPGPDDADLLWARSQVVFASAAAGIEPPLGPVSTNFTDLAALRESTNRLRRLGFFGRACIHPAQLAVVNEIFTPTQPELDAARALLQTYERQAGGAGIGPDGTMIDEAVIRAARRALAQGGQPRPAADVTAGSADQPGAAAEAGSADE